MACMSISYFFHWYPQRQFHIVSISLWCRRPWIWLYIVLISLRYHDIMAIWNRDWEVRISLGYPCGKDVITSLWTYRYTATFQLENYIYCLIKLFSFSCNLCILFLFLCFSATITVSILLYNVNCDALKTIKTTTCVLVIPECYIDDTRKPAAKAYKPSSKALFNKCFSV